MTNAAILFEPYRKHPSTPTDLRFVRAPKVTAPPVDLAPVVVAALKAHHAEDLTDMLFGPILSSGLGAKKSHKRVSS